MFSLTIDPRINLETSRCHSCGRWHAAEPGFGSACPNCQKEQNARLHAELAKAERGMAA